MSGINTGCYRDYENGMFAVGAVEIRNRMRSVDDLQYYGRWKREALRDRRRHDDSSVDVSLNQSYSGASLLTATDDEARPGLGGRRRRLRLRRRGAGGSVVSAPVKPQPVNLDESVGSAALDFHSMFRSSAAPAVEVRGVRSSRPLGLPPSGLPPPGRATSARRTSRRRRRRPSDVLNESADVAATSFDDDVRMDDVRMTSSTVELNRATTTTTAQPGVPLSRPVRRSQRRRRRADESPSRDATARDSTDVEAPATSSSAAPADVADSGRLEALWELCGEKLNEVCRRILKTGAMDTDGVPSRLATSQNRTERNEIDFVQPSLQPCNEAPGSPVSERERTEGVSCSVDVNDYGPSRDAENATTDIDDSATADRADDENRSSRGNLASVEDSVHQVAAGHVPPLDDKLDNVQFQMAASTDSPERCRDELEPDRETASRRAVSENRAALAVVVSDQSVGEQTSSAAVERRGGPGLDIGAMLSPSIELRDILDTIYTLTSGGDDTSSEYLPTAACRPLPGDAAFGDLDRVDDDDAVSLLDLDAEMYEYGDQWPAAAADLADSLHLAIADDDDYDIDIEHREYELDDHDDVL